VLHKYISFVDYELAGPLFLSFVRITFNHSYTH